MAITLFEIPVSRVNLLQHLIYMYKITNYEHKELTGSPVSIHLKISLTKGLRVAIALFNIPVYALATGGSGRLRSMQGIGEP